VDLSWAQIALKAAEQFEARGRRWASPGELAMYIDPRTKATPALDLIDQELVRVANTPEARLAISIAPQEGKTTRAVRDFIVWTLVNNPDTRIVLGSYNQSLANRSGRMVRNVIETNPGLGIFIASDNGAKAEWSIEGHEGGLISAGRGVGISGRPADLVVIDDPFKEGEAQSATIREQAWEWWTEGISARFGADTRVVVIHTRWHQEDLIGRLLRDDAHAGWRYVNIPAQADHDPAKGQTDLLGREPGEFMISARGRTQRQWEKRKLTAGSRVWNALYQGRPSPAEGGLLKRTWWRTYTDPMWTVNESGQHLALDADAELIQSWDMAFKATDNSDYVVGQVWLKRGATAYLLDQVRGRYDFPETIRQFRRLSAKWPQAVLKIVEDKANGPAVIASLANEIAGIVPEQPQGSKESRVSAVAPMVEAGNVWLPSPEMAPWVGDFIEEAAGFPNGMHDDQCDAASQALHRLLIAPLLAGGGDVVAAEDLYDDDLDYLTSSY
jgi:predicted phage terminase large subunit-like protein